MPKIKCKAPFLSLALPNSPWIQEMLRHERKQGNFSSRLLALVIVDMKGRGHISDAECAAYFIKRHTIPPATGRGTQLEARPNYSMYMPQGFPWLTRIMSTNFIKTTTGLSRTRYVWSLYLSQNIGRLHNSEIKFLQKKGYKVPMIASDLVIQELSDNLASADFLNH
jgi:hypothetical protein